MPDPIGGVQPFAELARGGVTVVYKGYQRTGDRFVLLKTVRPEWGEDEDLIGRFEEEARLAARVCHPNVVSVYGSGRDGATAYLITEFVEGLDLRALVGRGALPPALAAYVLQEAAHGLAAAHAEGILHRDLKPANLLISEAGAVKLTDFGLASLAPVGTSDGGGADREVRGTLAYLAPEIVCGEPPSRASDLFSLGALLVEMLTGRPAFARDTAGATLDAVLHHDPLPALATDPRVPPALAELAADLLAKDPRRRLSDAAGLAEALEAIRVRHGRAGADDLAAYLRDPDAYVPTSPPPSAPASDEVVAPVDIEAPATPRRRTGWRIAAGALVAVLLGVAGMVLVSEQQAEQRADALTTEPLRLPPVAVPADSAAVATNALPGTADVATEVSVAERDAEREALPEIEPAPTEPVPADAAEETASEDVPPEPQRPPDPMPEAEPPPGRIVIVAEPWARVRIDGSDVGTTPLGALSLPAGGHRVTFENPDFPSHTITVNVESGAEERLAVSLWDLVGRVTLVVSPWAEVAVDGTYWDTVPPQERPLVLTPGTHRLAFTHPALGTQEVPLRIAAGESRTLRVNLNSVPDPVPPQSAGREGPP